MSASTARTRVRVGLEEFPVAPLLTYEGELGEVVAMVSLNPDVIEIPAFQRDRIPREVQKIAAEWDRTIFIFPMVAYFRGHYLALDGQQRIAAAQLRGEQQIAILLVVGIRTEKRLAAIYLGKNRDSRLLDAFQKYVGALAAVEHGSVEIRDCLNGWGLEAAKAANATGRVPIGALVTIHERGGTALLDRVLKIRAHAWGELNAREANEGKTLLGLAGFLKRYWDNVDDSRLIQKLRKHHPALFLSLTHPRSTPRTTYVAELEKVYNSGLRGKNRLGS